MCGAWAPPPRTWRPRATSGNWRSTCRCGPGAAPPARWHATAGLDWPTTVRLMTAVGLPTDPDYHVTADEAAAIRLLRRSLRQPARRRGDAPAGRASPAAPWRGWPRPSSASFAYRWSSRAGRGGTAYVDVVKEYAEMTQTILPNFVSTLDAVLRRQIVAVAERMWSTDPEQSVVTVHRTVGFVDLVGYTSTTASSSLRGAHRRPGRIRPAHLRDRRGANGQIVKTIGDEAMFVTEHAHRTPATLRST